MHVRSCEESGLERGAQVLQSAHLLPVVILCRPLAAKGRAAGWLVHDGLHLGGPEEGLRRKPSIFRRSRYPSPNPARGTPAVDGSVDA